MTTMDELLTIQQAAELLRCHPNTIRRYLAAGRLPKIQAQRHGVTRIRREDLLNLSSS